MDDYPMANSGNFWLQGFPPASLPSSQIQNLSEVMDEANDDVFPQMPPFLHNQADFFAHSAPVAHDTSNDLVFFSHVGLGDQMSFAPLQSQEMFTMEFDWLGGPLFDVHGDDCFDVQATDLLLPPAPLPLSRKRKAPTLRDEDWAPVKHRVIQLHVDENIPLPEVKKQIEKEFKSSGFTATIRQYRSRLSQWRVDKNVKPKEMKVIIKKRQERLLREQEKRELMFRLRGTMVKSHKIERWMKRNGIPQNVPFSPSSIASTPSGLSVFTRSERGTPKHIARSSINPPPSVKMDWAPTFASSPAITSLVCNTNPGFRVFTAPEFRLKTQFFENLPIFQLPVPMENSIESLVTSEGASLQSDTLFRTVTETKPGQSSYPSMDSLIPFSVLKDSSSPGGTVGFHQVDKLGILLFIYLISNSFPADAKRYSIYQIVKSQKDFSQSIFRTLKGPSVDSLMENLFALAVEAEDVPMVKILITHGANVNTNNCKLGSVPIPMTPLQFACLKNNAALLQELIAAGSEIDAPQSGWQCSAILLALYGHEQFGRWHDGSNVPEPVDYELLLDVVQKLLDGGANVNNGGKFLINPTTESIRQWRSKMEPTSLFYELIFEEHSPLTLASHNRYHRLVDFLIEKGADVRFPMDGTSSALRQCLHDIPYFFEGKPYKLAERLYEWEEESEVRSTVVLIARRLIRAGANLNDHVVDECESEWCEHFGLECYSTLDLAILVGDLELVDEMLRADAKPTYHSLDFAIEFQNFDLFSKLLAKGAAIPNWAITEDYSFSSGDLDDCSSSPDDVDVGSGGSKCTEVQKRRALVLAAVRLGATSELKNMIESMDGFEDRLDDCTGLTRAIEDCCTYGHIETLQYLLSANIMPNPRPDTLFGRSVLLSIEHERYDLLDLLIENNADVNVAQPYIMYRHSRELPLSRAIEKGHLKTVQKLIRAGASVEDDLHGTTPNKFGTMLVAAIETGNQAIIDEVLGACEDINGLGKAKELRIPFEYCTPLTMAIKKRNWMLVDILRRDGAKVNHPERTSNKVHHHTALWAATSQKHFKLVNSLIKSGAIINDRKALEAAVDDDNLLSLFIDKLGTSPGVDRKSNALHFALHRFVDQGNISKARLILNSNLVDLDSTLGGETLHKMLQPRNEAGINHTLLNMLLTARANPNVFNFRGLATIHDAINRGDARSVQMILDAGAELNPPFTSAVDYSPAQLAAKSGNTEILQLLLAHGSDPNAVAPAGQKHGGDYHIGTALQCATKSKSFEAVQLLLMKKADPNAVTETLPHTALQIACRDGSKNIVELLITEGAHVNALPARKFGATALQFAALGGYLGIALLLLENGAKVNAAAAEVDGRTALEGAAEYGRIDMIQFLVDAGADLSGAGDGQYERALARAYNNGHHATRRLLLSYLS